MSIGVVPLFIPLSVSLVFFFYPSAAQHIVDGVLCLSTLLTIVWLARRESLGQSSGINAGVMLLEPGWHTMRRAPLREE